MENTEIMNEGVETMIEEVAMESTPKGLSTGMTMLIIGGAVAAVCAGAVLAKKAYKAYKAKKEMHLFDTEETVEPDIEE